MFTKHRQFGPYDVNNHYNNNKSYHFGLSIKNITNNIIKMHWYHE